MEINFYYEYECGGHAYGHSIDIEKEEFENDRLLVLVCSYISTLRGYPGVEIDTYLHNRFPDVHELDDMYGHSIYNLYDCNVEGLKGFYDVADGLLGMSYDEGKNYIIVECKKFNEQFKEKERENFNIWK